MKELLISIRSVIDTELFRIGDTSVSLATLLSVVLILVVTFWLSRALRRGLERAMARRGGRPGAIGTVTRLLHYAILVTGLSVALGTAGIDLTAMFAAGAIFAVGLGFAMQSIAQNFVAGVILLTERAIKPGDVLEVEGKVVKVLDVGIRASTAQTRDGEDLIIPNSILIQTTVKNFTLRDSAFRIRAEVGVAHGSDMEVVKAALVEAAVAVSARWRVPERAHQVIITAITSTAVTWEAAVWIDDPWELRPALSDLYEAVWAACRTHRLTVAFPQLDLHLDAPVSASLERLAGGKAA